MYMDICVWSMNLSMSIVISTACSPLLHLVKDWKNKLAHVFHGGKLNFSRILVFCNKALLVRWYFCGCIYNTEDMSPPKWSQLDHRCQNLWSEAQQGSRELTPNLYLRLSVSPELHSLWSISISSLWLLAGWIFPFERPESPSHFTCQKT